MDGIQLAFDYGALDADTRTIVRQRTNEIKGLMKRAAQDIIDIGQKLIEVKARLGHGHFGAWLAAEFEWSQDTANNFMAVARNFIEIPNGSEFAPRALYLLARPSTPEPARIEALEIARSGQPITYNTAQEITGRHKAAGPLPFTPTPSAYDAPLGPPPWDTYQGGWDEDGELQADEPPIPNRPHVVNNSGNNEWYTPAGFIAAARQVLGAIDLDPASSALANETVQAARYHSQTDDGLVQPWAGRVWMNPPYAAGLIDRFCEKLAQHVAAGEVSEAIVLVNNATETGWFKRLVDVSSAIVFPTTRVRFIGPGGVQGAPLQGQTILYAGPNIDAFLSAFGAFGWGARIAP